MKKVLKLLAALVVTTTLPAVAPVSAHAQTIQATESTLGPWNSGSQTDLAYRPAFSQKWIANGPDGFARIAQKDNRGIVMFRCTDKLCSNPIEDLVVAIPNYLTAQEGLAISIGSDGYPIFAYDQRSGSPFNSDDGAYISYTKCNDIDCASTTTIPIADASNESQFSIVGGPNGTDYIAFEGGRDICQPTPEPQNISLATIANGSSSVQVLAPNIDCVLTPSAAVAIGSDNHPAVSFIISAGGQPGTFSSGIYYYANGQTTQLDAAGDRNTQSPNQDIAIAPDGFARILYSPGSSGVWALIQCQNVNCTQYSRGPNIQANGGSFNTGSQSSLVIGSDGFPRILTSGIPIFPQELLFVTCQSANCSSYSVNQVVNSSGSLIASTGYVSMVANAEGSYSATEADAGSCVPGGCQSYSGGNVNYLLIGKGAEVVDPVPSASCANPCLLSGPAVMSTQLLQTNGLKGRIVKGVAADGVTEVLVRVPTANVGDQVTFALMNDQQQPGSAAEDGALGQPGATAFSQNQITVTSIPVTNSGQTVPYAFAVYRAPVDFARLTGGNPTYKSGTCGTVNTTDDQLQCRTVSLQITHGANGPTTSTPLIIVRPPVVMIHGLWGDWKTTWDNFSPLMQGNNADTRFSVLRVNYDNPVGKIATTSPPYSSTTKVRANSLGFDYNAPGVLLQLRSWIKFTKGINPVGIPIAAVQADVVAHSMGGDITRYMVLSQNPKFLLKDNFQQGYIHKVITIGTPHLGTPIATRLLNPSESGQCLQSKLAGKGYFAFNTVTLNGMGTVQGAVSDLKDDGTSVALNSIATQNQHPLPIAFIAGAYTDWAALDSGWAYLVHSYCGTLWGDPLAQSLTSTGWQAIFNNQTNDSLVSLSSALNGISNNGHVSIGFVHGQGMEKLGFSAPSLLDPPVPDTVILLLNTPFTQTPSATGIGYIMINP